MQIKTAFAVAFVIPTLLLACNRADHSPTAAVPGQEKQAVSPVSPDRTLERSPPAAGMPGVPAGESGMTPAPQQPAITSPDNSAPATQQNETRKAY